MWEGGTTISHISISIFVVASSCILAAPGTFRNPLFPSQDPFVLYQDGSYYYSESDGDSIYLRVSATLSGLGAEAPRLVWSAARHGPDGHANIWAPEIHSILGRWFLYFAADYATDGRHRLYVIEATNPFGPYSPGNTGSPDGQLAESSRHWAIDPDVFTAADGKLYLVWSCTDDDVGRAAQNLCIVRMSDPLHIASETVRLASPTEAWEMRTGAIEEGPVGIARNGTTYVTYSASASWTTDDYTAGVLVNSGGDPLDPASWRKYGPILDRHGQAYGPGSPVFIASRDGSEWWLLYHGYDRLDCGTWACRSIRMQRLKWDSSGLPLVGYAMNPGVPVPVPSGDRGSATGWGDSRDGAAASGEWIYESASAVQSPPAHDGSGPEQTFREGTHSIAWSVSAEMEIAGRPRRGEYGIYALYQNAANYVAVFIDAGQRAFGSHAVAGGIEQGAHLWPLGPDFDGGRAHTVLVRKGADREFALYLDGEMVERRTIPLDRGQVGVFTFQDGVRFRKFAVTDDSYSWGDGFGDAAEGCAPAAEPSYGDGYARGLWEIGGAAEATSTSLGAGWHTLYRGNPNLANLEVGVEVRRIERGTSSTAPQYGMIVCHDDRSNQVSVWVDEGARMLWLNWVAAGTSGRNGAPLPAGFDGTQFHRLSASKAGAEFRVYLDGVEMMNQAVPVTNGSAGIATEDVRAEFRNFGITER